MRLARNAIRLAIAALAFLAVYRLAYLPYRCNIEKREIQDATIRAVKTPEPAFASRTARENVHKATDCLAVLSHDVDLYMLRAANYRLLRDHTRAIADYQAALKYDRRPEIYLNLALAQLDARQTEAAIENFVNAVRFNPKLLEEVPIEDLVLPRLSTDR